MKGVYLSKNDFKIINLISGKGGTGKTLFAAVLADSLSSQNKPTLVIDMDIFVRGLTTLLFREKKSLNTIINNDEMSIYDIMYKYSNSTNFKKKVKVAVCGYRKFFICPSVSKIKQEINFWDNFHKRPDLIMNVMQIILKKISLNSYSFVIIDNRSGLDEYIFSAHKMCDLSICITEDDEISQETATILIENLKSRSKVEGVNTDIFEIINKARDLSNPDDIDKIEYKSASIFAGKIPFDMSIMQSFDKESLWSNIYKSLYIYALKNAWNKICADKNFKGTLINYRPNLIGNYTIESKIGILTLSNRIIFIYGILLNVLGSSFNLIGKQPLPYLLQNPSAIIGILLSLIGLYMVLYAVVKSQIKRDPIKSPKQ